MDIDIYEGYSAVADVFAMAQLLEIAIAYCEDLGIVTLGQVISQSTSRSWLRGE
jgi:hypothetical protein